MLLEGKRAIVTGGASGIAAATVHMYAAEGAAVVSMDINDEPGRQVAEEAASNCKARVLYLHCDVSEQSQVEQAFAEAVEFLGGLDSMAMIAGIEQQILPQDVTAADLDRQLSVHVHGTAFTNAAAFKYMHQNGGSIINYASWAGVGGFPEHPTYAAAKGAVLSYTRTVAWDWGKYRIRANAVCPGVATPLYKQWLADMDEEQRREFVARLKATIPLGGELADPEDAADLNVFLASDRSRFMTGQTIGVDGGLTMPR